MSKFKKYCSTTLSTKDYHLTTFTKEDKRKDSYSKYVILCEFLAEYGIWISMSTHIYNLQKEKTDGSVYACRIDRKIPVENIAIIEQMYGYQNALVSIMIDNNEDRSFSFWFNTKDHSCELCKNVFGSVKWSKKYPSFKEMMEEIRSKKSIDELVK